MYLGGFSGGLNHVLSFCRVREQHGLGGDFMFASMSSNVMAVGSICRCLPWGTMVAFRDPLIMAAWQLGSLRPPLQSRPTYLPCSAILRAESDHAQRDTKLRV